MWNNFLAVGYLSLTISAVIFLLAGLCSINDWFYNRAQMRKLYPRCEHKNRHVWCWPFKVRCGGRLIDRWNGSFKQCVLCRALTPVPPAHINCKCHVAPKVS